MAYSTLTDLKEQIREDDLISLSDDRVGLASNTLGAALTSSATTVTLTSSSSFPTAGRIEIGYEQIDYTGNAANVLSGCTRGANSTTATAHDNASTVTEKNYIDTSVTTRAIADADAEIDGYCKAVYDVPFSPVPVMVRKISVDIAIYNLYARRKGAPEDRRNRYKDAIKFLENVAKGIVDLGSDAPSVDDDAGAESSSDIDDRIFTMSRTSDAFTGTLEGF